MSSVWAIFLIALLVRLIYITAAHSYRFHALDDHFEFGQDGLAIFHNRGPGDASKQVLHRNRPSQHVSSPRKRGSSRGTRRGDDISREAAESGAKQALQRRGVLDARVREHDTCS